MKTAICHKQKQIAQISLNTEMKNFLDAVYMDKNDKTYRI